MTEKFESVISALQTLRAETLQCPKTEKEIHALAVKYDIMFLGKDFNTIYSLELCHTLKTKFGMQIELSELNQMVPEVCKTLQMSCEPMQATSDMSNPVPAAYKIILFE